MADHAQDEAGLLGGELRSLSEAQLPRELVDALSAVRVDPSADAPWDAAERVARSLQRPDELWTLYEECIVGPGDAQSAERIAIRAVRFYDEWFQDRSPLIRILFHVLDARSDATWAFERLSLLYSAAAQWTELLDLYDRVAGKIDDPRRRRSLLQEASQVARDFTDDPDRAVRYLDQCALLEPEDTALAETLERLYLERGKYREAIALWTSRLRALSGAAAIDLRLRIANTYVDSLDDATSALAELEATLGESTPPREDILDLLERIGTRVGAEDEVRRRALELLRDRLVTLHSWERLERVLEELLSCAEGKERIPIHRALADRFTQSGREHAAIAHLAAVVMLEPTAADVREQLRSLADHGTEARDMFVRALVAAAERSTDDDVAVDLFCEAARTRLGSEGDRSGAAMLYFGAFMRSGARAETRLELARTLVGFSDVTELAVRRLDVLEELAQLATDPMEARQAIGAVAHQAEAIGDVDRAIGAWQKRLERDSDDTEALTDYIALVERAERWDLLVLALERRVTLRNRTKPKKQRGRKNAAPDSRVRDDLVAMAHVLSDRLRDFDAAARCWLRIETMFGTDAQVDEALFRVLDDAGRHQDIVERLTLLADRERNSGVRARWLERRGDVLHEKLGLAADAAQSYVDALAADPRSAATASLHRLLEADRCPREMVSGLVRAHAAAGDEKSVLSLLELRLRATTDVAERASILLQSAAIAERALGDREMALSLLSRAFVEGRGSEPAESALLERVADDPSALRAAVAAYEDTIARAESSDQRAQLCMRLGRLFDRDGHDAEQALGSYQRALIARPNDRELASIVIECAARAARWDMAAQAVVLSLDALGEMPEDICARLEAAIEARGAWQALSAALDTALAAAPKLSSGLVARMQALMARWHRDRLADLDGAESLLLRSVETDAGDPEVWRALAELQRRHPGPALVRSLVHLSGLAEDPADVLHEAAGIALGALDGGYARAVLERYFDAIRDRWERGHIAPPDEKFVSVAEYLAGLYESGGDHERAVRLLREALRLPVSAPAALALRRRAALTILQHGGGLDAAVELLRGVTDQDPADIEIVRRLSAYYDGSGQLQEQRTLWERALAAAPTNEARLESRLELANALSLLGSADDAVETLRASLTDVPGHAATLAALTPILERQGRSDDLAALLVQQARLLDHTVERERGGDLWAQAADVFETMLGDTERALESHRQAVAIRPTVRSLEALARVNTAMGEHTLAAKRLEQLRAMCEPAQALEVTMRLARAYAATGDHARGIERLREAWAAEPHRTDAKALLVELYRASQSWDLLYEALAETASHEMAPDVRRPLLREAAEIAIERLDAPRRAVPLLAYAVELDPSDDATRVAWAAALRLSGDLSSSRACLLEMLTKYGRRRPPEKAAVHFQLAHIARDAGDMAEALEQLDLAIGIDVGHAAALRMLGEVSREAGQLERAEHAFRMLLLIARRYDPERDDGASENSVGPSEVLYQLHVIAERLHQERRSRESLESAFEAARHSASESRRLERALRNAGASRLLVRALKSRLVLTTDPTAAVGILRELAAIHRETEGDDQAALELLLQAVAYAPLDRALHDETRSLAAATGRPETYVQGMRDLAERSAHAGASSVAHALYLLLGEACETLTDDPALVASAYEAARKHGPLTLALFSTLEQAYTARAEREPLESLLRQAVTTPPEGLAGASLADAMYRLAEMEIQRGDRRAEGIEHLLAALDVDPQPQRAAGVLIQAADAEPDDSRVTAALEKMARLLGDRRMLLTALERRLALPNATVDEALEAAAVARDIDAGDRVEALLQIAVKLAQLPGADPLTAVRAMIALVHCRRAAGDDNGARYWLRQAAERRAERVALMEIARLATDDDLDLPLAADAYEKLSVADPSDRRIWEPLLGVYRQLRDQERLERAIKRIEDSVFDSGERNVMRLERAKLLVSLRRWDEAISALRYVMGDDPENAEATALLKEVFRQAGRSGALAEFLRQQLVRASEREDSESVVSLSLELGALLATQRRSEALEVYLAAAKFAPGHRGLLDAQLALLQPSDPPAVRAEVLERILAMETEHDSAGRTAEELASLRESLGDSEGAMRALAQGVRVAPGNLAMRARLEALYSEHGQIKSLADLIEDSALSADDASVAADRLRRVAELRRDGLHDRVGAVAALRKARQLAPAMPEIVVEIVSCFKESGDFRAAETEIAQAIDGNVLGSAARSRLLILRSELHALAGNTAAEIADLQSAYGVDPTGASEQLLGALKHARTAAAQRGDAAGEGAATHQLAELLAAMGNSVAACQMLAEWLGRSPRDARAWRLLAQHHVRAERWGAAAEAYREIVGLADGNDLADAVLQYADACERLGRAGDAQTELAAVVKAMPSDDRLRARLRVLYEKAGAHREIALMNLAAAESVRDDAARYKHWVAAGELWLRVLHEPASAIEPLRRAHTLRPNECEAAILLADAFVELGRPGESEPILKATATALKGRRVRELAGVQHRLAQIAMTADDRKGALAWLSAALENDMQNGPVASDLAEQAMALRDYDLALKALRAIALMKSPGPMTRAMAFHRQAVIALEQDDRKKAIFYAKKALAEDASLLGAATLLKTLEES